jgi:hypothetical protein
MRWEQCPVVSPAFHLAPAAYDAPFAGFQVALYEARMSMGHGLGHQHRYRVAYQLAQRIAKHGLHSRISQFNVAKSVNHQYRIDRCIQYDLEYTLMLKMRILVAVHSITMREPRIDSPIRLAK